MNRSQGSGRQDGTLDTLLALDLLSVRSCDPIHERLEVGEVTEPGRIDGRLGADGQGFANLGDNQAYLASGHLDPRMFGYGIARKEPETDPGHQQLCLISCFPTEGNRIVAWQLLPKSLADKSDLRRSN